MLMKVVMVLMKVRILPKVIMMVGMTMISMFDI